MESLESPSIYLLCLSKSLANMYVFIIPLNVFSLTCVIFAELLFKSFEDLENPETKLDALGRKHLQLVRNDLKLALLASLCVNL